MLIVDQYELHALHKLLGAVKFSEQISSYDLNEFANSPLITNLLKRTREKVIENLKAEGQAELVEEWLNNIKFRFDSATGIAICNRLKHLSPSTLDSLRDWSYEKVLEYAQGLVEPLPFDPEEIDKLAAYIVSLAKEEEK